jgi:hypothetical protein
MILISEVYYNKIHKHNKKSELCMKKENSKCVNYMGIVAVFQADALFLEVVFEPEEGFYVSHFT